MPINQRDMVGTVLAFLVAYVAGLTAFGYLISRREREALTHLWRDVGLLSGIREGLWPTTFAEALEVARGLAPGARERAVRRGRAVIEADMQKGLAGQPPDFQPRFVGRRPGDERAAAPRR